MYRRFQLAPAIISRQNLLPSTSINGYHYLLNPILQTLFPFTIITRNSSHNSTQSQNVPSISHTNVPSMKESTTTIQSILKDHINTSTHHLNQALDQCGNVIILNDEFVLQVLKFHRSEWKSAYRFFDWALQKGKGKGYSPGTEVYNEVIDILGRMKRFDEVRQVFDEMSQRKEKEKGKVNEITFRVLLNRYAGGHKVDEAIEIFEKRRELGFEIDDLFAFQTLLLSLCRYKHVDVAERLFLEKRDDFPYDIKTSNIILNGWCVLGSLREAKRFWKDILSSKCRPDRFTYGIFINCLCKNGKVGTAKKLFRTMWKRGCTPDVAICNCVIDALCFKKRVPEALEIFEEMKKEEKCPPDVATYNSLIKHLCKIVRMEKVYELLSEMEEKKGSCAPDVITFNCLLNSLKKPEQVPILLERMRNNGCEITGDTYNVILKLYLDWNDREGVQSVWAEMEKYGVGPDQRSYTIMIHRLHRKDRIEEALKCYNEMISKGMIPEPKTTSLATTMKSQFKERENQKNVQEMNEESFGLPAARKKKNRRM
ncbi:hypothetical protein ACHQM5_017248 [Ranunculus cassubicifolius]